MRPYEEILSELTKEEKVELIETAKQCFSVDALKKVCAEKNIMLDADDVNTVAKVLGLTDKLSVELTDDDLAMVSGGLRS